MQYSDAVTTAVPFFFGSLRALKIDQIIKNIWILLQTEGDDGAMELLCIMMIAKIWKVSGKRKCIKLFYLLFSPLLPIQKYVINKTDASSIPCCQFF